jgi:hypothetical protein
MYEAGADVVSSPPIHIEHFRYTKAMRSASLADHLGQHQWSGVPSGAKTLCESVERSHTRHFGCPDVVDFVSVGSSQIHKLHQVLSRNLLILREENWVGNLVPNRVPEPVEVC